MSNKLYKCIALNKGKAKSNHSESMMKRRKTMKAIFFCALFVTVTSNSFWFEITNAHRTNTQKVLSSNDDVSISYTNSSFMIESASQYGNFSFTFEWKYRGLGIFYNGTLREMKELGRISFTDKTAKYKMEYWVPIILYEYIDMDGNNILNNTETVVPDISLAAYKILENIAMTNITINENVNGVPICEWNYTQLALPMASNVRGPWDRFPVVNENFHYYPLNGTLKMDIILRDYRNPANEYFRPENVSSRFFLSYGVRYVSLEAGNATVVVAFDGQELTYYPIDKDKNQTNKVYPTTSSIVTFKVNREKRGFFDFGGKVTIDGNPDAYVNGSVGPIRSWYYYQTDGEWLEIGLNYPHVNQTLIHDPYFGLYSKGPSPIAISFPFEWTAATAVISVIICTGAVIDYFRTKRHYLKYPIQPLK